MPTRHPLPLIFLGAAFAGFLLRRAIPAAYACLSPLDTSATFDLALVGVNESSSTGASTEDERATWTETATLAMPDHRIDFSDGTHLVFE
jgi:hypothetical protein